MDDQLLEVRNLSVRYRSGKSAVKAVNGLNIHVKRGETLGLVGETGAGKTTTALSIMNLLPERTGKITGGEILYKGKNLLAMPYKHLREIRGREIAMIFQDPMTSLNPIFSVGAQIGEVLKMHTKASDAEIDQKVCEVLEMVGIPKDRRHDFPHQFSGGMKQRVVIAMAIICKPE
ncbi:MAG TPA: ABC transporter ATP-binding protein, partial [Anaerolineaceae bacterium]|nr:ABC transporter ATP-binding protein [Anaerolineaceae bacterium]